MKEPDWVLWARSLPPDRWESWRLLADLGQEYDGRTLEAALEAAYEAMVVETSPAPRDPRRAR